MFLYRRISTNIYSTVSRYIPIDREFCTLYIDAVYFFHILIFCLFSAYYCMMSLSDFRPIFRYEFELDQSAAEAARKINQAFGNDSKGVPKLTQDLNLPPFVQRSVGNPERK